MYKVDTKNALYSAVGAASAAFAAMTAGKLYIFTTSTACFIKQGTGAQTAAAAAANTLVAPDCPVIIDPGHGVNMSVIQAAAGGHATLTPFDIVR